MIKILNEVDRINNILKEGMGYDWTKDAALLAHYYKLEGYSRSEIINEVLYKLRNDCEFFKNFNGDDLKIAKDMINRGINNNFELNAINNMKIDKAILNYISSIKTEKDNMNDKKVLFTMYVWFRLLNFKRVIPDSDSKYFRSNCGGISTAAYRKSINNLIKYNFIKIDSVSKIDSSLGYENYILNFELDMPNNNIILPEKNEGYKNYITRILETRKNNKDDISNKIVWLDKEILTKNIGGKNPKIVADNIYLYPREYRECQILLKDKNPLVLVDPINDFIELEGPQTYSNELCKYGNYKDDLHNPGRWVELYYLGDKGTVICADCGKVFPKPKTPIKKGEKYRCLPCKKKSDKTAETEKILELAQKINGVDTKNKISVKCGKCSKDFKVNKNNPKLKSYMLGLELCKGCAGIENRKDIYYMCDKCGKEAILTYKTETPKYYQEIKNNNLPKLCGECRREIKKSCGGDEEKIWEYYKKMKREELLNNSIPIEVKVNDKEIVEKYGEFEIIKED